MVAFHLCDQAPEKDNLRVSLFVDQFGYNHHGEEGSSSGEGAAHIVAAVEEAGRGGGERWIPAYGVVPHIPSGSLEKPSQILVSQHLVRLTVRVNQHTYQFFCTISLKPGRVVLFLS